MPARAELLHRPQSAAARLALIDCAPGCRHGRRSAGRHHGPLAAAGEKTRSDNVIVTFALLLFAVLATLLSRRAADRYSALENARPAYRTPTDGANDDFYMTVPVRDRLGVTRDFDIVDCNERGAGCMASDARS